MSYDETTSQLFGTVSSAMMRASASAGRIPYADFNDVRLKTPSFNHTTRASSAPRIPGLSEMLEGIDGDGKLIENVNDQVDEWLAKYFPAINGEFRTLPEDWIVDVISGVKPYGTSSTIFEMVWHQARDRAYRTVSSEQRNLAAAFSQRGFTLPPGAMVAALAESERRASEAVLDVSRDQASKDADIKADILKHATSLAAQLKAGILSTSGDFLRTYLSATKETYEKARIRAHAYSTYVGAMSDMSRIEVAWEDLRLQAAKTKADVALANDRNLVSLSSKGDIPGAHARAAAAFTDIAAQAANAAGTFAAEIRSE